MEKLRNGKWSHQKASAEEVAQVVEEIKAMIAKYGWEERTVRPYSYSMTLKELVESDGWNNFKHYNASSRQLIISEINGVIEMLNIWEAQESEEKVTVRLINGNEITYPKSVADELIEIGMAEAV